MNFTLNQLLIFVRVCEAGSITKASESLHMTQPAVSIQLKNFQVQFEVPLTETVGKKIHITEFGRIIESSARGILLEAERIGQMSSAFKNEISGKLHLTAVSTGKYVVPFYVEQFLQHYPRVEMQIDVTNKNKVAESLRSNTTDFGWVSIVPKKVMVEKIGLLDNALYLVCGKKYSGLKKKYDKKFLESVPWIFREEGSGTREVMEGHISRRGINIHRKIELTSSEAVKQAVISGMGISIMPLIGLKNELGSGDLKIIASPGLPLHSRWHLVWMKGKRHSPAAEAFLRFIREKTDFIQNESFS
ncbi:MAG: LysR family transcriptional regulator, partial [Flavobacteriales bacterium]